MAYKNKNDYSIIVFDQDEKFLLKWTYVHGLYGAAQSLDKKYEWKYFNVYNRRSGQYIGRYYRGGYIPNKPRT
jgi:hypothetical protein